MSLPPVVVTSSAMDNNSSGGGSLQRSGSMASAISPTARMRMMMMQQQSAGNFSPSQSASALAPGSATAFSFGDILGGTAYFMLESLVARLQCDRIALFLPHPKYNTLIRVAIVGPTAPPVGVQNAAALTSGGRGEVAGSAGPVTVAVLSTGVAANLSQVAAEDAQDCPGTSVAKTALIVPIRPFRGAGSGMTASIGVIFAVNKRGGSGGASSTSSSPVFTAEDQLTLVAMAPSLAYLCETYPVDFSAHRFDPTPLHRIIPLVNQQAIDHDHHHKSPGGGAATTKKQHSGGGKSKTDSPRRTSHDPVSATSKANPTLPEKPPQLVYEQAGDDSLLPYVNLALEQQAAEGNNTDIAGLKQRAAALKDSQSGDSLLKQAEALSTAQQITSVGQFVQRMEQCWRDAIVRCLATERELQTRSAQVQDAHSILHRKQKRLEVLKDVLVETLEKRGQGF